MHCSISVNSAEYRDTISISWSNVAFGIKVQINRCYIINEQIQNASEDILEEYGHRPRICRKTFSLYSGHVTLTLTVTLTHLRNYTLYALDNIAKIRENRIRNSGRKPCHLLTHAPTESDRPDLY